MGLLDDAIREHLELRRRQGADAGEVAKMEHEALGPVVRGEPIATPEAEALLPDAGEHLTEEPALFDDDALPTAAGAEEHFAQEPDLFDDAAVPAEAGYVGEPQIEGQESLLDQPPLAEEPPLGHTLAPELPAAAAEPVPAPYVPPPGTGQPTEEYDVGAYLAEHEGEVPGHAGLREPDGVHAPEAAPPAAAPAEELHGAAGEPAHDEPAPDEPHAPPAAGKEADDVLEQTPEFLQETPEHDRLWFEQAPPKDFDFDR